MLGLFLSQGALLGPKNTRDTSLKLIATDVQISSESMVFGRGLL